MNVDWNADPRTLANAPASKLEEPPFRVIWLRDGGHAHWAGMEPNVAIWSHLQAFKQKLAARPATTPS